MNAAQIPEQDQKSKAKKKALEPGQVPEQQDAEQPSRWVLALKEIVGGNAVISVLAIFVALVVGALFIAIFNEDVQEAAGYFFSRPGDTFAAAVARRRAGLLRALPRLDLRRQGHASSNGSSRSATRCSTRRR